MSENGSAAAIAMGIHAPIPPSTQEEPSVEDAKESSLNELAIGLYRAKRDESDAKKLRVAAELAIAALVTIEGVSGSKTVDAGEGLKVTVKQGVNYKADVDAIRALDLGDDADLPVKCVPSSYVFDAKAYEVLRTDKPGVAAILAEHVVVTPSKPAVTIKLA